MRYRIRHTTKYEYSDPVAVCHNVVRLTPRTTAVQTVDSYRLIVHPDPSDFVERTDVFGNRVEYFSIQGAHKGLSLTAVSDLLVEAVPAPTESPAWEAVRDGLAAGENAATYRFVFPSLHAPLESALRDYAQPSFTPGRPIIDVARDFTTRLHADFKYDPRATTVSTPVLEAFEKRAGVCQDFAHLQIAGLRAMGLAARYVSGYLRTIPPPGKKRLVGADASHAWLSVYCGPAGWVDFDPTNDCIPQSDHITSAIGRDYGDVCPIQGVFVGGGSHTMSVSVDVEPRGEAAEASPATAL